MSTRANIILKESGNELFFYRHSDGYPAGTLPTLQIFVDWLKTGKIRRDLSQGGGWLIIIGAMEYATMPEYTIETVERYGRKRKEVDIDTIQAPEDWKVGAYEPTNGVHGDIEYLYTVDMAACTIAVQKVSFNYKTGVHTFSDAFYAPEVN